MGLSSAGAMGCLGEDGGPALRGQLGDEAKGCVTVIGHKGHQRINRLCQGVRLRKWLLLSLGLKLTASWGDKKSRSRSEVRQRGSLPYLSTT